MVLNVLSQFLNHNVLQMAIQLLLMGLFLLFNSEPGVTFLLGKRISAKWKLEVFPYSTFNTPDFPSNVKLM